MSRVYNFSAGPSALPEPVLIQAQEELPDWHHAGLSVMEMTHRGKDFVGIAEQAEADLRELLNVPSNYRVLFLQGGATGQFAAVPLNLANAQGTLSYVNTGIWSQKAISEGAQYGAIHVVADAKDEHYTTIPDRSHWTIDTTAAYLHYTANETIGGVEFQDVPDVDGLTLISDMSSNLLSRSLDVSQFGLIYAGAQKNMGPAGIVVVIVREDLIGNARPGTPSILDYQKQAEQGSMLNTPPTYTWYLLGLVLNWLKNEGGIATIEARNRRKSEALYQAIDSSPFYSNPVEPEFRSRMNVPFRLAEASLEKSFLAEAKAAGLINLEGHRSVGGLRASIYNAMPENGVHALIGFMKDFARRHG